MIDTCLNNRLTGDQYLALRCLFEKRYDELVQLFKLGCISPAGFNELTEEELLVNMNMPGQMDVKLMKLTDKALKLFDDNSDELFDEFVDAYPRFLWIEGKRVAALNADMGELQAEYERHVLKKGLHDEVMDALNWARKNHEIHMGIKLWLGSRQWKSIQEIMNDNRGSSLPSNNLL